LKHSFKKLPPNPINNNFNWIIYLNKFEYRFAFNGMEKIDEINGAGNDYDYGARIYDARLGRWLSLDPLVKRFPSQSPFNFVANNPLVFADHLGEQKDQRIILRTNNGDVILAVKVIDKDEVNMSIQKTSTGDALYSMNIHEDLILDVRNGNEGIFSETNHSIKSSGFAAIADQLQDAFGGHEGGETKDFGFVNTGGDVGSVWVLGLPGAKVKENIDMSGLITAAGKYGPESKGLFEKLDNFMGSIKVGKGNLGEVMGVLAKTIQKQYDYAEKGKDIGMSMKKVIDNYKMDKKPDSIHCKPCNKKHANFNKKDEK
jgi:RHS repeat-associated protein